MNALMKTMIKATCPVLLLAGIIALAACQREAPVTTAPPTATAATAATDDAHHVDATAIEELTPPAASTSTLDTKALAGRFSDGASVLELRADGSYLQTLDAGGSSITADGTWTAAGEAALLLDPNSKSADDARFDVVGNDELRSSDGAHVFHRIALQ